jgi:hypothetical protein
MRSLVHRSPVMRRWVALAALALLWQALLPLAQAMQPRAWVTLCTATGLRTVPIEDGAPLAAGTNHCVLCRLATAAGDAPLAPALPRHEAVATAHEVTLPCAPAGTTAARCTPPPSRAPPG